MEATSTPIKEELIVRYLLGRLSEKQQVEIEDRAFQDQQYLQGILDVESDLIDDYVRGEIPLAQRHEFERHFLASAERRRKVEFARALATVTAENEVPEVAPLVVAERPPIVRENPFLAFIRSLRPVPALGFAAMSLLLLAGGLWLIRDGLRLRAQLSQLRDERQAQEEQRHRLEEQFAGERARTETLTAQIEQLKKEEADRALQHDLQQPVAPTSSSIVTLLLLPGLSRASNTVPHLKVTPDARTVRLQVGIDPQEDYPSFLVELHTQTGAQVWRRDKVPARKTRSGRGLVLSLPAGILGPGRYELVLKGMTEAGSSEAVGYYYFEVLTK